MTDPKLIAESLNDYFVNIGLEDDLSKNSNNTRFCFSHIDIECVLTTLKKLNAGKSTGLDKLPPKFLKLSADVIAPTLTCVYLIYHSSVVYTWMNGKRPV